MNRSPANRPLYGQEVIVIYVFKLIGIALAFGAIYGFVAMVKEYRRPLPLGLRPFSMVKWVIAIYAVVTFPTVFIINYYAWK